VTSDTGLAFRHTDGGSGRRYIVETVSSGLATLDYDGDGLIDIYFPNGAPLPGFKADPPPRHALYKNLGGWRFQDVSEEAGVACRGYGLGAVAGDYDDDGWPDLYVSNFGPKVLYRNHGDGTFTDVTALAGVADGNKVGAGACFLDADGDGRLDLYVANYLVFSFEMDVVSTWRGVPIYPGPERFGPLASVLYRNRGDGAFTDVSGESGVAAYPGKGMGIVCADYDDDGDTDVFVANDGPPGNFLFRNDGSGRFEETSSSSGTAFSGAGLVKGNMGVDCGDYDNDGMLDFFVTAYQGQGTTLYRNLGAGLFEDVTTRAAAGLGSLNQVTWGCGLVDLDNDGHKDVFFACGHLIDNIDLLDGTTSYMAQPVVLRNTGQGTFVNVSDSSGDGLRKKSVGRGAAFDDLDNDGDIDIVILNSRREPTVLRNLLIENGSKNHWLQIQLRGVKTNRDGVGARVRVTAGDLAQVAEVHGGRGYQGHFGSRLHFGLARHQRVDRVEVRWIGGGVDVVEDVAVDQLLTICEGQPGVNAGPMTASRQGP
jgi:hypothetical protein